MSNPLVPNTPPQPHLHPLVKQLRAARIAQGISQLKLAIKLGYGDHTVHHMEFGKHGPGLRLFVDYAKALGYNVVLEKIECESSEPTKPTSPR